MRELSNVVLADGKEIPVGKLNVKCRKCTIDVVNNIDSEGVFLKLLDPARAGVFVPSEQKAGEDLIVLQMPMMI